MASGTLTVTVKSRYALAWIRAIRLVAPVLRHIIGNDRLLDLARWGATRLTRIRIGNGPWRSLVGRRPVR